MKKIGAEDREKWVEVKIGGITQKLFTDTGSDFTIIPPQCYRPEMGRIQPADTNLRAWGNKDNLDVKGLIKTEIKTKQGARKMTKIYIVDGFRPEPLLGDKDAEYLGYITFHREGRKPTHKEKSINQITTTQAQGIPQRIRDNLEITVETHPDPDTIITQQKRREVKEVVDRYKGLVFNETKIGNLKTKPAHLNYDQAFKPVQPPYRKIPIHYQDEVSKLLKFLRQQGAVTDVDPRTTFDCVMNAVITDKKNGSIRMNIDNTPQNPGLTRTKFHVQTPQEIRHELKEAKIFSEMDMGWGYHQIKIDEETKNKAIFQTHEGIHRMERLYFGPTASSGIFHSEVRKALAGLTGTTNIHDNILVWGRNHKEHLDNLKACLERCAEKGIILKPSKSNFCMDRITWFGRTFTSNGVTTDPEKLNNITQAGRPTNTEDVRSLLMACQFNAKFVFDHPRVEGTYEEITLPLRKLLQKDAEFKWDEEEDQAYQKLIEIMNNPSTLQPYKLGKHTHIVTDASEYGIQASIYQETTDHQTKTQWVPIDHASRTLTPTEQRYSPIERESLAISWGLEQFRFYVVGSRFTCWTDHQPLIPILNNIQKPTSKRISRHRDKIQDLQFTAKYLPGKNMPCDYGSRHATPINHLNAQEQEQLRFDNGQERNLC